MFDRKIEIKNLSYSAGNVYATINGKVFSVALPALAQCQLYMVYFTSSGLVISTNPNSAGPAGYIGWRLIGAFWSDGMSSTSFGAFVNISGVPVVEKEIPFEMNIRSGVNILSKGGVFEDNARFRPLGSRLAVRYGLYTQGGGDQGTTLYTYGFPPNFTANGAIYNLGNLVTPNVGNFSTNNSASQFGTGWMTMAANNRFMAYSTGPSQPMPRAIGYDWFQLGSGQQITHSWNAEVETNELSNTPLVDR